MSRTVYTTRPIGVLAASRRDYEQWIIQARKIVAADNARKLIYLADRETCASAELSRLLTVPGFHKREDAFELYQLAKTRVKT